MFRLIFISLQFAILVILASWAVNNSYVISIAYKEFIFSTSSSYIIVLLVVIILTIFFIQSFYFKLKNRISNIRDSGQIKNKEKGYDSFWSL